MALYECVSSTSTALAYFLRMVEDRTILIFVTAGLKEVFSFFFDFFALAGGPSDGLFAIPVVDILV